MPLEYYLGGTALLIVLVLLASALRNNGLVRRSVPRGGRQDERTIQLKRIADALERIAVHVQVSPPSLGDNRPPPKPSAMPVTEAIRNEQPKGSQRATHQIKLSMFGR